LIATEGMWCCETDLAGDGAIRSVAPHEPGLRTARVLVRLHGEPLGYVTLPALDGDVDREQLLRVVWARWSTDINEHLTAEGLGARAALGPADVPLPAATTSCPNHVEVDEPVSVVVCTHNRSSVLPRCLTGLQALSYPHLEIIVVDNAPADGSTRAVVEKVMASDDRFRYVVEPRAGLSYARNKGLATATGRYLAYTDDDVSVDPGWIEGLVRGFQRRPDVGCVTGLVCTASVNTAAEAYFDARAASWSTRPRPEIFDMHGARRENALYPYSAGLYGTGANFAFDRAFLIGVGGFDEALGAGARTRGGEDLDAFVTTLLRGRAIAYEPSAIVWHHHRAGREELLRQLYGYGTGFAAFIAKTIARPSTRWDVVARVPHGLQKIVKIRSDTRQALGEEIAAPRGAALVEFAGYAAGPYLYWRAKRDNRKA
jgi:glycosyltransferase involved in cell wall biosynthesis